MDFSSRGAHRPGVQPTAAAPVNNSNVNGSNKKLGKFRDSRYSSILWLILIASVAVLVIALILAAITKSSGNEASYVKKDNYQVVAFTDKQAYFGKIKAITSNYLVLDDVFYLQDNNGTNQGSSGSTNSTLVKRGCEIHRPQDRMVIYRDQINFWENLENNGKVAEAIKQFKQQNPKGQDCNAITSQQQSQSNNSSNNTSESTNTNSTSNSNNATPKPTQP
jgi:hypothetical protein